MNVSSYLELSKNYPISLYSQIKESCAKCYSVNNKTSFFILNLQVMWFFIWRIFFQFLQIFSLDPSIISKPSNLYSPKLLRNFFSDQLCYFHQNHLFPEYIQYFQQNQKFYQFYVILNHSSFSSNLICYVKKVFPCLSFLHFFVVCLVRLNRFVVSSSVITKVMFFMAEGLIKFTLFFATPKVTGVLIETLLVGSIYSLSVLNIVSSKVDFNQFTLIWTYETSDSYSSDITYFCPKFWIDFLRYLYFNFCCK